jgi:hypothetical protein
MKIIKYFSLLVAVVLISSCQKHEIQYDAVNADNMAEFQLHYVVPVTSASANNITKVEINGQLLSNVKAPLNTYNAIPSGAVGRFYTVNPGSVSIKMYQGTDMATLVYNKTVTLNAGKQNVFVHDFAQNPVIFDNGFPYPRNVTAMTDSTSWVKFYNFLYETTGAPTTLKIQYQYLDSRTNLPVNIGPPIAFGQSTDWQKVTVVKLPTDLVSAGSRTITFNIKTVDANGNLGPSLQIMGTNGQYSNYTATATLFIGRRYHHIFAGFRAMTTANASVRVFTAL